VKEDGALIKGKIVEASMDQGLIYSGPLTDTIPDESNPLLDTIETSADDINNWMHPKVNTIVYNRNEGLRIMPLNWSGDRGNNSPIRLGLSLGYRSSQEEFIGRATLQASLLKNRMVTIYASGFKESKTDDDYRLTIMENTWANILGKKDYYDRWDEMGFLTGISVKISRLRIKGEFAKTIQSEITVDTDIWSLFNRDINTRINPLIQNNDIEYFSAVAEYKTSAYLPLITGFSLLSEIEIITKQNNQYLSQPILRNFNMLIGNLKLSDGVILRNRFLLGISLLGDNSLPKFRYFSVGGLGSVSAFNYKAQRGTNMNQYNAELIFTEDFTKNGFLVKLIYDAGMAYDDFLKKDGNESELSVEILQSAGIGFGWTSFIGLNLGFNFAKQLSSEGAIETTIRLNYNF